MLQNECKKGVELGAKGIVFVILCFLGICNHYGAFCMFCSFKRITFRVRKGLRSVSFSKAIPKEVFRATCYVGALLLEVPVSFHVLQHGLKRSHCDAEMEDLLDGDTILDNLCCNNEEGFFLLK